MPHTGKVSGACKECKARHRKSNRECSGYAEGLDLVLRDQTKSAKTAVERRQKESSRERPPSSGVTVALSESEDAHALCFLVSSYVTVSHDPRTDRGFLELLPCFFSTLKSNTALSLALNAVANCFFAAWERRARFLETHNLRTTHGKALKATRAAISDPIECSSDETLMAVCLLGLYEVFRALHTSSPIDPTATVWQDPADMPRNPGTILDLMSVEVANILALEKSDTLTRSLSSFATMAKTAEHRLATWPDSVPQDWFPKRVARKMVPITVADAGLYGDGCDIYSDVLVCCTWNEWRSTRLKLLSLIVKYEPNEESLAAIQHLADEICASFPFLLGDRKTPAPLYAVNVTYPSLEGQAVPTAHYQMAAGYGGWYMLEPLRQAIEIGMYLRQGQQQWIRSQGSRLANIYDVTIDKWRETSS
ncbi:MAG: hypothetical protein Q9195_008552 [Heterodermia aff. obscurata]